MQLIAGGNISLVSEIIEILIKTNVPMQIELDLTAYLLAKDTQKVRGDQGMSFCGQRRAAEEGVVLVQGRSSDPYFTQLKVRAALLGPEIQEVT